MCDTTLSHEMKANASSYMALGTTCTWSLHREEYGYASFMPRTTANSGYAPRFHEPKGPFQSTFSVKGARNALIIHLLSHAIRFQGF